ncbi:MAG TPA: TetR/AcrR family transcriptional regulator [Polyangium sp.]|nr:TetR/AcrR family transcriptional regulator [Polyangium sp.]
MPRIADPRARIDLLRAAEAIFAENGLAAAKVEDITIRAGVSKGAFYLHFKSKQDCFRQIVEGVVARLASCVEGGRFDVCPPGESLEVLLESRLAHVVELLEFCWQNRAILGMILTGGGGTPYAYLIDAFTDRIERQSETWLRHSVEVGLYRDDIEPAIVSRLIAGTHERLVREIIKQPRRPDIEGWARQAQDLLTRGLFSVAASAVVDRTVTKNREREEGPREPRSRAKAG